MVAIDFIWFMNFFIGRIKIVVQDKTERKTPHLSGMQSR